MAVSIEAWILGRRGEYVLYLQHIISVGLRIFVSSLKKLSIHESPLFAAINGFICLMQANSLNAGTVGVFPPIHNQRAYVRYLENWTVLSGHFSEILERPIKVLLETTSACKVKLHKVYSLIVALKVTVQLDLGNIRSGLVLVQQSLQVVKLPVVVHLIVVNKDTEQDLVPEVPEEKLEPGLGISVVEDELASIQPLFH